jgi:hypothetical protein
MCREFIVLIISDVFNNLLIYSKFKGGAHAGLYSCRHTDSLRSSRLAYGRKKRGGRTKSYPTLMKIARRYHGFIIETLRF